MNTSAGFCSLILSACNGTIICYKRLELNEAGYRVCGIERIIFKLYGLQNIFNCDDCAEDLISFSFIMYIYYVTDIVMHIGPVRDVYFVRCFWETH